jgi:polyisoprenoid-binding protein YceI
MSTTDIPTWEIDTGHSGVSFTVRHLVVSKVRGRFATWAGKIVFDEAAPERSSVEVRIEAASIDTGVAERDAHLKAADFLDVEKFPAITFRSTRIARREDGFDVAGDFTIHGVTREVVLPVVYGGRAKDPWGNQRTGFGAQLTIDRKDFGLKWNQLLETGGLLIGDQVEIDLEVEAVLKAAAEKPVPVTTAAAKPMTVAAAA